jgi:hypothetical protein
LTKICIWAVCEPATTTTEGLSATLTVVSSEGRCGGWWEKIRERLYSSTESAAAELQMAPATPDRLLVPFLIVADDVERTLLAVHGEYTLCCAIMMRILQSEVSGLWALISSETIQVSETPSRPHWSPF